MGAGKQMNLYLLKQDYSGKEKHESIDTYDSCVVVANNEEEARLIHPNYFINEGSWCKPELVIVKFIGIADEKLKSGDIIISSFNAG